MASDASGVAVQGQVAPAAQQAAQPQSAVVTPTGAGTQWLAMYLQQGGRPDPMTVAAKLGQYPNDATAMMQLVQQTLGNGFAQQVIAAQQGGAQTSALTSQPSTSTLPPTIADGTVVDGGALGPVVSASATAQATVNVGTVGAQVTSIAGGQPALTISAAVALTDVHAGSMTPAETAQVVNVTKLGGIGGTVTFAVNAGVLQLTLAGVSTVKALATTTFKLWLASGQSIALTVKASTFHTEISEMDRTETQSEIANEQSDIASETAARSAFVAEEQAVGKTADTSFFDQDIQSERASVARDQQQLAAAQGPRFVDLDANGVPVKQPQPQPQAQPQPK